MNWRCKLFNLVSQDNFVPVDDIAWSGLIDFYLVVFFSTLVPKHFKTVVPLAPITHT